METFQSNYKDKTAWGRHVEWVKQSLFLSRTNSKQAVILSSHLLKSNDEQDSSDPLKAKPIASTALFEALARKDEVELLQDRLLARIERETVGY